MGIGSNLAFSAGHFELALDGVKTTSFLKSVEAGFMSQTPVKEQIGSQALAIHHAAVADVDPVTFEIGMAGSAGVLQWIQASWDNEYQQRSGQINHANFNMNTVFEHGFSDALVTETQFPTLDGASKEAAYLKVKFQPKAITGKMIESGPKITPVMGSKQKMWLCNAFRLNIDGIDDAQYVNKIESFTIKQNVKKLFTGRFREIELFPTKIEFPQLSCTISLAKSKKIYEWYEKYVAKGQKDPKAQRTGSLEFLTPDRKQTLFRITMFDMGIFKANIQSSTANSDQIKRMKFDFYVGKMKLDGPGALGLE